MEDEMKQQLQLLVASTINGDDAIGNQAFKNYITTKMAMMLNKPQTSDPGTRDE